MHKGAAIRANPHCQGVRGFEKTSTKAEPRNTTRKRKHVLMKNADTLHETGVMFATHTGIH